MCEAIVPSDQVIWITMARFVDEANLTRPAPGKTDQLATCRSDQEMNSEPQQSCRSDQARSAKHGRQILFVSELYHPEDAATAFFITKIAEAVAEHHDVTVYCAQPSYHQRHLRCAKREKRCGVTIKRCFSTRFDRNRLWLRAVNISSFCCSVFFSLLSRARRSDLIVVGTNPPFLPVVCWLVSLLRGCSFILRIEDLYPQLLVAAGLISSGSLPYRCIKSVYASVIARATAVVVLGRDMKEKLVGEYGNVFVTEEKIRVIPNWGEAELLSVPSTKLGSLNGLDFSGEFVVLCAGNLGRVQDLETILAAAEMQRNEHAVRFLIVGSGAKKAWLQEQVAARSLRGVTLIEQVPRAEQAGFLAVSDVGLVSLIPAMSGISVPSRTYNLLAAGKPVVALVEAGSEIGRLVGEHKAGWRVNPGDAKMLSSMISRLRENPTEVADYGRNARRAVLRRYNLPAMMQAYRQLVDSCE